MMAILAILWVGCVLSWTFVALVFLGLLALFVDGLVRAVRQSVRPVWLGERCR